MPSFGNRVDVDAGAEAEVDEDRELVRGVPAADVERRVGFGVAELLRLARGCRRTAGAVRPSSRGCSSTCR